MALTFAAYAVPGPGWLRRVVAATAVALLVVANLRGISRTAALSRVLVAVSVAALLLLVAAIACSGEASTDGFAGAGSLGHGGVHGLFRSAALLFFAFAGYARIATLGEEVRDPERTIPRAIALALAIVVVLYAVVAVAALAAAGPQRLATSTAPLEAAAAAVGAAWAQPIVRVGAAVASLGALLALIAGVGRTALAMARHGDLPRWLAAIEPQRRVPDRAEIVLGAIVVALVLTTDLRGAIGFSSFGVLLYYAVANAAAFTQRGARRRSPRALNVAGGIACVVLVASLPRSSIVAGVLVLAVGVAGRVVVIRRNQRED
jgi:basic amino acid/polyamine antiporter, APA family